MDANQLKILLEQVRDGAVTPGAALEQIKPLPYEDLGFAKVDHHRAIRVGVPEVIFGPGKTPEHFVEIFTRLADRGNNVLATRVSEEQVAAVVARFPAVEHNHLARTLVLRREGRPFPWRRTVKPLLWMIAVVGVGVIVTMLAFHLHWVWKWPFVVK